MSVWADNTTREILGALRRDPDDQTRWQVLGDWLTERGDARGPIVTLEHRLRDEALPATERRALQHRLAHAEAEHVAQWRSELSLPSRARPVWRGGLLVAVWLPWDGQTLSYFAQLREHPAAALLTHLDLGWSTLGDDGVREIAASDALSELPSLSLSYSAITNAGVAALAASDALSELTALDLSYNDVTNDAAFALAAAVALSELTALDLKINHIRAFGGDGIVAGGAQAIAASSTLTKLTA